MMDRTAGLLARGASFGTAPWFLSVVAGIALAAGSFALWRALAAHDRAEHGRIIESAAIEAKTEISRSLIGRANSLRRMAERMARAPSPSREQWESDAEQYLRDFPGLRSIGWIDPSRKVRWTIPREERTVTRGFETARDRHSGTTTSPVDFPDGTRGFLVVASVFHGEVFAGAIAGAFRFDEFLNDVLPPDFLTGYSITVYEGGEEVYRRPTAHLADEGAWSREVTARVQEMDWRVRVTPEKNLITKMKTALFGVALVMGLVVAVLVGAALYLWQSSHLQAVLLSASEERFRAVWQAAMEPIVTTDAEGRIVSLNPAAERAFQYTSTELADQPLTSLIPDRFADAFHRGTERYRATEPTDLLGGTIELTAKRRDGTEFPVDLSLTGWRQGQQTFFTAILRDISERKRAEEMRSDFVRMIGHDIKNPLASILGVAQILRARLSDDPELTTALDRIEANAFDASVLTMNFLDADKIESGALELSRDNVSLNQVVAQALERQESRIRLRHVTVIAELAETLPSAELDKAMIDRVVGNLVSNAVKFSPEGSCIWIRTASEAKQLVLSVRDSGPGIAPEDRPKLFQRYSHLSTSRGDSSGLGLFIVKTIVEAHGGTVKLDCPPEGGAIFEVDLPLAAGA